MQTQRRLPQLLPVLLHLLRQHPRVGLGNRDLRFVSCYGFSCCARLTEDEDNGFSDTGTTKKVMVSTARNMVVHGNELSRTS